jgi:hypothetical protein
VGEEMKVYLVCQYEKDNLIKNIVGIFTSYMKAENAIGKITSRLQVRKQIDIEARFLDNIYEYGLYGNTKTKECIK